MPYHSLLPTIRDVLAAIRQKKRVDDVVELILEKACSLADAVHGSFVLVDHEAQRLTITNVFGSDWSLEKQLCQLKVGEGLTGKVAATGQPYLSADVTQDPEYYPLFDYIRSELIVPVFVQNQVWGLINLDGLTPNAFDESTLSLLTVFAELAAFAITLRLEMNEQDKLYKKLLQSEKLASLGETIAGIAHEINNPLTSILGHASLLTLERGGQADKVSVQAIVSESQRAADLVKGLLEFSRKETGKRELVDARQIISQVVNLKKYQLKMNNVELIVSHEESTYPVLVCPQQIKQVLLNLINNAEQAVPKDRTDGIIRLSTSSTRSRVHIMVIDNGKGIAPEMQKFVFDPFFTTKGPGDGTGLGLSIAYSIMEAHGGGIYLTSSTLNGTTFTLELPLAEASTNSIVSINETAPVENPAAGSASQPKLRGRVLLVDDEPQILESLGAYLEMHQMEVLRASSGQNAVEILEKQKQRFDVIVSDIRMPGIDGLQLYDLARQLEPYYEKSFIFMSGYLMRENTKSFLSTTGVPCLEKPFSFDELRRTMAPFLGQLEAAA